MEKLCCILTLLTIYLSYSFACNCTPYNSITAASLNADMKPGSPDTSERSAALVQFLQQNPPGDVLCLQGIYDPNLRGQIVTGLMSLYPYSYYADRTAQNCQRACTAQDLSPVIQCATNSQCMSGTNDAAILNCLETQCGPQLNQMAEICTICMSQSIPAFQRFQTCSGFNISQPQYWSGCEYFFDGQSSPLILSNTPFITSDVLHYTNSSYEARALLYVSLNSSSDGPTKVFCTDLNGMFTGDLNGTENSDEINEMKSWIATKVQSTDLILLMGDFNTGPEVPGALAVFPNNYNSILSGPNSINLQEPLMMTSGTCTYCSSDILASQEGITSSYAVDHIFMNSGWNGCYNNASIFANNPSAVSIPGGQPVPISSHYGVKVQLCSNLYSRQVSDPTSSGRSSTSSPIIIKPVTSSADRITTFFTSVMFLALLSFL